MRALVIALMMTACLAVSKAEAGGFYGDGGYCRAYYSARYLLSLDFYTLREEVYRRYIQAVDVFNRRSTIYSESARFEWANQTKIACAKAIGYLRRHFIWRPEIDVESIQKCECFYDRMVAFR